MKLFEVTQQIKSKYLSDEAKQFVLRHCQPYLREVGYDLDTYSLFRGISSKALGRMEDTHIDYLYMSPGSYSARKPSDTPLHIHDHANKMFTQHFGVPFRNGIFVTGNARMAKAYGGVAQIIPIGDFKYCWSPQIHDFIQVIPDVDTDMNSQLSEIDQLVANEYSTTNLKQAILSHHEIMIYCSKVLVNFTSGMSKHYIVREGGLHIGDGDVSISVASKEKWRMLIPKEADIYCNMLVNDGYSDWTIPTVRDAKMIIKYVYNNAEYKIDDEAELICKGISANSSDTAYHAVYRKMFEPDMNTKYLTIPIRRSKV